MALYTAWSPTQRWARAVQLRAAAWELKVEFCRQEHPGWAEDQIVTEVRRQFLHALDLDLGALRVLAAREGVLDLWKEIVGEE
jgi:hypothetical protein